MVSVDVVKNDKNATSGTQPHERQPASPEDHRPGRLMRSHQYFNRRDECDDDDNDEQSDDDGGLPERRHDDWGVAARTRAGAPTCGHR